nr:thymidylate synthase [Candidatus Njordarchaeota archaeon]
MCGPFLTRSRNVDMGWRSIINKILENGKTVYTERKRQRTLECVCGIAHITDWRTGSVIPQNYIGLSPQVIEEQYWPQYASSEKGEHTYTYGWCMQKRFGFNQIQYIVETLKKGEHTAFAQFWNPVVDSISPDPPCINIVMFQRVKNKINLIEYIRSTDIARAWSEDVSGSYAVFMTEVAAHFGGASARGDILTISGSAHVYETALDEIKERFQSSYSASNSRPVENTSTLFGPVLRAVKDGEKCSNVVRGVIEEYSYRIDDHSVPLSVCLKVYPTKEQQTGDSSSHLNAPENMGRLGRALRHFEGRNDQGFLETIDQITWAKAKAESTPESRRIVVTPNNPWKRDYFLDPIIIQFLVREETIHTIAVYRDVNVGRVDEDLQQLSAVTNAVKGRNHKLGPLILLLIQVRQ